MTRSKEGARCPQLRYFLVGVFVFRPVKESDVSHGTFLSKTPANNECFHRAIRVHEEAHSRQVQSRLKDSIFVAKFREVFCEPHEDWAEARIDHTPQRDGDLGDNVPKELVNYRYHGRNNADDGEEPEGVTHVSIPRQIQASKQKKKQPGSPFSIYSNLNLRGNHKSQSLASSRKLTPQTLHPGP
jgi:hypothetical protein